MPPFPVPPFPIPFPTHLRFRPAFPRPAPILPPILANTLIVPFVLYYGYGMNLPIPFMMLTVGIGEIASCGVLGMIILLALERYENVIFRNAAA